MEILFFVGVIALSSLGLLLLDRDRLKRLDSEDIVEEDEYFMDHK